MTKPRVLITACGAHGSHDLIKNLQELGYYIHGVDTNPNAIGRFISDHFSIVSPAHSLDYVKELSHICILDKIDVIFAQSTTDVIPLSKQKKVFEKMGIKVMISDYKPSLIAMDKGKVYSTLKGFAFCPKFRLPITAIEFTKDAMALGYLFDQRVVCRLPSGKGGRGMFMLNIKSALDKTNKGTIPEYSMVDGENIFANTKEKYVMTEFVDGEEIDSMVLCDKGEALLITHKTREAVLGGNIMGGVVVKRPELDTIIKKILKKIPLSHNISIQFKGGKLIEINPRSSSYIYGEGFNEAELAIGYVLGKYDKTQIINMKDKIPYGRRMLRYIKQMYLDVNQ